MAETTPELSSFHDPPKALELLGEVIDHGVRTRMYPAEAFMRARHVSEPWLVDDLMRVNYLREVSGILVPTILGLRAIATPAAVQTLQEVRRLFEELKGRYVQNPNVVSYTSTQLEQLMGVGSGHLLLILATTGVFNSVATQGSIGSARGVTFDGSILGKDPFKSPSAGASTAEQGPITLTARDFQGLTQVEWSPDGVCLVVGPNGSGKTTLLKVLAFLRDAFQRNVLEAVQRQGGSSGLRRLGAGGVREVRLGARVGEIAWELRLPIVEDQSVSEYPAETVTIGESIVLRRAPLQSTWYLGHQQQRPDPDGRTCLRAAWDAQDLAAAEPLIRSLRSFRYYFNYDLGALHKGGSGSDTDRTLDPTGQNLFVVLRNWKVAPRRFDNRFEWVLRHVRRAFPGVLEDIEFDPPVGQVVPARFFPPGGRGPLPMSRAADGLLVGLLHLTAVAGADDGSTLAIDEMENQLHPHAIRAILEAMRERADERRLTVLLTTHSPVLMNAFRDHPEQLYVMEVGERALPVPLDKLHDPDWLAHFELGDLYERLEFGAPPKAAETA